jgi:HJR/Mrr/RecB family endonuclease
MDKTEVETITLQYLYKSFFSGETSYNVNGIGKEVGWDDDAYWRLVDYMTHQGFVSMHGLGKNCRITSKGIYYVEENNLAPKELQEDNERIRAELLDTLANIVEASSSPFAHIPLTTLLGKIPSIDPNMARTNLEVLGSWGLIDISMSRNSYQITDNGLLAVKERQQQLELVNEFERISKMAPQARGWAFQKFIAKLVEKCGWYQEESARTTHEEFDVVIHKEREYYFVECKWLKDKVGAGVVQKLLGELNNRSNARGIIVSMSGYTDGAIEKAENSSDRRIIFFGPKDVHALVEEASRFDALLNEKYQLLITRGKIQSE